jgi:arylamine N-acetyltransferase
LHYTKAVVKSLAAKDLYEKIVERRWGGTCTENNKFFGIMLRSLGFKVRPIGARVHRSVGGSPSDTGYFGWNHCLNLVTFDGKRYLIDVAMGPTTPAEPIPLGEDGVWRGIGLTKCRLRWDTPEDATDPDGKLWIYEQNNDGKSDFVPTYCFSELEFSYADYEVMKAGTTFNRQSWFTWRLVCVRTVLDEENDPTGSLILVNNSLKRKINGKTEHIATFKHEGERIAALKEWFGIELNEDEAEGIKGMVSALPDGPHANANS